MYSAKFSTIYEVACIRITALLTIITDPGAGMLPNVPECLHLGKKKMIWVK